MVENGNWRKCISVCRNNAQVLDGWRVPSCVLGQGPLEQLLSLHQTPSPGKSQGEIMECWLKNSLKTSNHSLNRVNVNTTISQKWCIFNPLVLCNLHNDLHLFIIHNRTLLGILTKNRQSNVQSNIYTFKSFSFEDELKHMTIKAMSPLPHLYFTDWKALLLASAVFLGSGRTFLT